MRPIKQTESITPSLKPPVVQPQHESTFTLSNHWRGGLWKVLACACFAAINGMVRYLTSDISGDPGFQLPSYVVVFLQNIFGTLFLLPFVIKKGIHSIKTSFPGLESIRVLFSVFGLILWYASLAHMQIAEAVALAFTGPIITIIASRFCLKESLSPLRLMAICISFIGAFMIMRPDRALFSQEGLMAQLGLLIFLPLLSAAAFSGAKISGRALARKGESATVMTFYLLVFMAPISFIPA
ncbi:MAG: DMT family transporter, partial [Alphaproteobacteria bacterium]|nr:DMT family transporter [Alphaproteobacteria bacterium]